MKTVTEIVIEAKHAGHVTPALYESTKGLLYQTALRLDIRRDEIPGLGGIALHKAMANWMEGKGSTFLSYLRGYMTTECNNHRCRDRLVSVSHTTHIRHHEAGKDTSTTYVTDSSSEDTWDELFGSTEQSHDAKLVDIINSVDLSLRDITICKMIADDKTLQEIADHLDCNSKQQIHRDFEKIKRKFKGGVYEPE